MFKSHTHSFIVRLCLAGIYFGSVAGLVLGVPLSARAEAADTTGAQAAEQQDTEQASDGVSEAIKEEAEDQTSEKRKKIVEEAKAALRETSSALEALDKGETDEALAAMERATGKLEIILARDPDLALAPVGVTAVVYDVVASIDGVRQTTSEAATLLEDGKVQAARELLEGLRSEYVISVSNLPMATYPLAIKTAAALVDQGKIEEAQIALQNALNTVVVTETVLPLPLGNARSFLDEAKTLAENSGRNEEENRRLASLLDSAQLEMDMARALGYGSNEDLTAFSEQIKQIRKKTEGGKSGEGFFDKIQSALSSMFNDSQPGSEDNDAGAQNDEKPDSESPKQSGS